MFRKLSLGAPDITRLRPGRSSLLYLYLLGVISKPQSPTAQTVDEVPHDETSNSSRLTKETSGQTGKHCLSYLREVVVEYPSPKTLLTLGEMLKFVNRLETLQIAPDEKWWVGGWEVQVVESLVSHICALISLTVFAV